MELIMFKVQLICLGLFLILASTLTAQISHIVEVKNMSFIPKDITVSLGDTVIWKWGNGSHTTTSDSTSGNNTWNSPVTSAVPIFKKIITGLGLHRYYCLPHGAPGGVGMAGSITANAPTDIGMQNRNNSFKLFNNYPNPFNPTTSISYELQNSNFAKLTVYNVRGELIKVLVNGEQSAGNHIISFDGSDLNSGVYFYKLETDGRNSVSKMTLLK